MSDRGLDITQAAARLGVSPRTMQRYLRTYLAGDTSRGFVATKLHTNRGKGYEWRFAFDDDATPDATGQHDTPPADVAVAIPAPVATEPATLPETEAVRLLLGALDRALDQTHRVRLAEAEAARLRALVAELRRPWWRRWWYTYCTKK